MYALLFLMLLTGFYRWRTRLLQEGNEALTAFVDAFPAADPQRIRQLASRARKLEGKPAVTKAKKALLAALKDAADLA